MPFSDALRRLRLPPHQHQKCIPTLGTLNSNNISNGEGVAAVASESSNGGDSGNFFAVTSSNVNPAATTADGKHASNSRTKCQSKCQDKCQSTRASARASARAPEPVLEQVPEPSAKHQVQGAKRQVPIRSQVPTADAFHKRQCKWACKLHNK